MFAAPNNRRRDLVRILLRETPHHKVSPIYEISALKGTFPAINLQTILGLCIEYRR